MEKKSKELEKMTVTELRGEAKDIPDLTGVHAMKKAELLEVLKKKRGKAEKSGKKTVDMICELKEKIKALKKKKEEIVNDKKGARLLTKSINRLKKQTRRMAGAAGPKPAKA